MRQTDILIVGGGVGGLTLAVLLADVGISVDLIEPYPPEPLKKTKITGRTVALMEGSLNVIRACGVWDSIKDRTCPMQAMRILDDSMRKGQTIDTEFSASNIGMTQFGYNIPNSLLRAALYEKAAKAKTIKIHNCAFTEFEQHKGHIVAHLENDATIRAALMVGADGRNSRVREKSGIAVWKQNYNQKAITCVINHSRAHNNTATEFHRAGGPFALVPLPGNQSSVVWVETPEHADELLRLKKHEFEQALQKNANDILGGVTLEIGPEAWPLCSIKAKKLIAPRIALIAEAAHIGHLIVFGNEVGVIPKGYLYFAIAFSLMVEFFDLRMKKNKKPKVEEVPLEE